MNRIVIFLTCCFLILLSGCNPKNNPDTQNKTDSNTTVNEGKSSSTETEADPPPKETEPTGTDGFDLMEKEKIGNLQLGMDWGQVVKYLGEPEEKTEPQIWGADGMEHVTYNYPSRGIELDLARADDDLFAINSISISEKCDLYTSRGIKIGDTAEKVKQTYPEIGTEEYEDQLIAGSIYGGVIFTLDNEGKVVGVFVGAAAE